MDDETDGTPLTRDEAISLMAAGTLYLGIEEVSNKDLEAAFEVGRKWMDEHDAQLSLPTHPYLGLATTLELLQELESRIEHDYFSGGGGLHYSTFLGRPEEQPVEAPTEEKN